MQNNINSMQYSGNSSPAVNPQANPFGDKDIFYQYEQAIGAEAQKIVSFVNRGLISKDQGHTLLAQLAQKAQQINNYKTAIQNSEGQNIPPQAPISAEPNHMELFNQERPGFFDVNGRGDVLDYIKGFDMDKDELLRISQLVENLENSAVDNYLKKSAYEKSLNDENAIAKSKLTAYAQNSPSDGNFNRIFTREEIGKMSGDEFSANEKAIYEQLKQGLIK